MQKAWFEETTPTPADDWLTEKWGDLDFCWDGDYAYVNDWPGGCRANSQHYFVVDDCQFQGGNGGATKEVYRSGKGWYHQVAGAPPPGSYDHWIYDKETGDMVGRTSCSFNWGGEVPHEPAYTSCVTE